MKNFQQNFKKWPWVLGIVCVIAFALSSCFKNNNNNNTPMQPVAAVAVIDASPDAPALDFYINSNQVNGAPLTLGTYINYFSAYAGKRTVTFYQSGTTAAEAQDTVTFGANHYYSLFLANVISKADFILLQDSLIKPASGSISIRLVNVSPNAGAVDLGIKGVSSKIVQNVAYKGASTFTSVPVSATDTLQVTQAGTTNVLASIPPTTGFVGGTVYTVWLYGLANTSVAAQQLNANIMVNATFY